ncbi:hypothetical protein [Acidocella sp.]|uniref:hypothetical protein n=1 Tax=Acidocella sp. TaxID=50710 RepID=UPI003CFBE762
MDENLAKDFVAVWQSELTAMAADRELRESWAATLGLWAQAANAAAAMLPHDPAPGSPRAAQPPRPAPAAAASGPGVDEVEQLSRRVAELEQRLAELLDRRDADGPTGDRGAV